MSCLVNINVFSGQAKSKPDVKVLEWLRLHESQLYVSTAPTRDPFPVTDFKLEARRSEPGMVTDQAVYQ